MCYSFKLLLHRNRDVGRLIRILCTVGLLVCLRRFHPHAWRLMHVALLRPVWAGATQGLPFMTLRLARSDGKDPMKRSVLEDCSRLISVPKIAGLLEITDCLQCSIAWPREFCL